MKTISFFTGENAQVKFITAYKHNQKTYHSVTVYWKGYGEKTHSISKATASELANQFNLKINNA